MLLKYTSENLAYLRSKVSLIDIIKQDIELKKEGTFYKGHCPFAKDRHKNGDDSDASFIVYPADKKTSYDNFYCYGCHVGNKKDSGYGSDIFEYIRLRDGLQFSDAVKVVASLAGITFAENKDSQKRENLYSQVLAQNRSYWTHLQSSQAALKYLEDRGLTKETIDAFRLGLVPQDALFEPIRGRLAIPIIDMNGKACGFGYRTLNNNSPKYLNSSANLIFKKGDIWYGLYQARQSIMKNDCVIFVEGYFDVMLLHQYGVRNAVACMSTAVNNLDIIKKYTKNAIVWTDGDLPGREAASRYINALNKEGFYVKVVETNGDTSDPADIALIHKDKTLEYINNNLVYWAQYKLDVIMSKLRTKIVEARVQALPDILKVLSEVNEQSMLDIYINWIKDTLEIDYGTIMSKLTEMKKGSA